MMVLLALVMVASGVQAQEAADNEHATAAYKMIGAGLGLGLAGIGTGLSQGPIGAAAVGMTAEDEKKFTYGLIFTALQRRLYYSVSWRYSCSESKTTKEDNAMSLETLAAEIIRQAREEADLIIDQAKTEAKRIEGEANEEALQFSSLVTTRAEKESEQIAVEVVASAKQANQKKALIARREELELTWKAAREEIGSAKMSGRKKILDSLVKEASEKNNSDMILRPVKADRSVLSKSGFKIGDDVEGLGGFVLESKDGSTMLDFRFDLMLEEAWKNTLGEINGILFN